MPNLRRCRIGSGWFCFELKHRNKALHLEYDIIIIDDIVVSVLFSSGRFQLDRQECFLNTIRPFHSLWYCIPGAQHKKDENLSYLFMCKCNSVRFNCIICIRVRARNCCIQCKDCRQPWNNYLWKKCIWNMVTCKQNWSTHLFIKQIGEQIMFSVRDI